MFENIDWGLIMDATLITLACAIISVAGTLAINAIVNHRGYKDVDKKVGKLDNTTLSGQHQKLEEKFESKITEQTKDIKHKIAEQTKDFENKIGVETGTSLGGRQIAILNEIKEIKSDMKEERLEKQIRLNYLDGNMAGNISKIQNSIENLSDFSSLVTNMAKEITNLSQKATKLENQNSELTAENEQLRKIIQDAGLSEQSQGNGQLYGVQLDSLEQTLT